MKISRIPEKIVKTPWRMFWGLLFFAFNSVEIRHWFPWTGEPVELGRVFCLRRLGARLGRRARIRSRAFITTPKLLRMGAGSKIGNGCTLHLHALLSIGENVEIGPGLTVLTSEHVFSDPGLPLTKQGSVKHPVVIEDDVYIGAGVTILAGVTIRSRTIVAAGAVVTTTLDGNAIFGGVPARKLRELDTL